MIILNSLPLNLMELDSGQAISRGMEVMARFKLGDTFFSTTTSRMPLLG
jgi:hypothetical protein